MWRWEVLCGKKEKKKKTEKSIPVNTKCHTKTDRAIKGTLRSDTETCRYQGWPHRRCSQGWRKCKRLLQFSFLRTFITFNCTNFTDTVMTRVWFLEQFYCQWGMKCGDDWQLLCKSVPVAYTTLCRLHLIYVRCKIQFLPDRKRCVSINTQPSWLCTAEQSLFKKHHTWNTQTQCAGNKQVSF